MYDYVLQLGFDRKTQETIENMKSYLKQNQIKDKERNWLAHITIDLYNCKEPKEFLKRIENLKKEIKPIPLEFKNLNHFENKTLYIEPYCKTELIECKEKCNQQLGKYQLN